MRSLRFNYAYADATLTFRGGNRSAFLVLRIAALLAVMLGSIAELPMVWTIADVAMSLVTLVNVASLVLLTRRVTAAFADYETVQMAGHEPAFSAKDTLALPPSRANLVW